MSTWSEEGRQAFEATVAALDSAVRRDADGLEAAALTLVQLSVGKPDYLARACAVWADAIAQVFAEEGRHLGFLLVGSDGVIDPDSVPERRHEVWSMRLAAAVHNRDNGMVHALLSTPPDGDHEAAMWNLLGTAAAVVRRAALGGLGMGEGGSE